MAETAILLLAFGGPQSPDEVRPFIESFTAGRNVPPARVDAVIDQYQKIGGKSPFNELTNQQAAALRMALEARDKAMPVYVGFLFSNPSILETLRQATADGAKKIVAIVMAVHREASFERYKELVHQARITIHKETGVMLDVQYAADFHVHPLFIEAVADRVIPILEKMTRRELYNSRMIFTAHSIPVELADRSGYEEQIQATASAVASRIRGKTGRAMPWTVAYQSRSGAPNQPWLDPDVQHELAVCKKLDKTHVVVVPVGFLCDHVEVLFDLDVLAAQTASELGMVMMRAPTVGYHPTFIRLLVELATDRAESFYARPER